MTARLVADARATCPARRRRRQRDCPPFAVDAPFRDRLLRTLARLLGAGGVPPNDGDPEPGPVT